MTKKLNVVLMAALALFTGVCVFAEEPEFSVSPGDQSQGLQIKMKENPARLFSTTAVEYNATDVVLVKVGNTNTVKLNKMLEIESSLGTGSLTVCGAVKVSGQKGYVSIVNNGATNLIIPGYRLEAMVNDGKFYLRLLVVGTPEDVQKEKGRYVTVASPNKLFTCGEWIFFTAVFNRTGKAEIFVNGELVASDLVQQFEKDKMDFYRTWIGMYLPSKDVSLEIAGMEVYYGLLSSVDVDKLKDKWLAILKK